MRTLARDLAIAMANERFAVSSMTDQWDAPYEEAQRIVDRLRLVVLPADGVIVTPDSLAQALHMNGIGCVGRDAAPRHLTKVAAVLAAVTAGAVEEETHVARADAPSPLRPACAPSEGAQLG